MNIDILWGYIILFIVWEERMWDFLVVNSDGKEYLVKMMYSLIMKCFGDELYVVKFIKFG